jgi:hypothetical protein
MGLKIAVLAAASVLSFVQGRVQPDGGYAEPISRRLQRAHICSHTRQG